MKQEEFDKLYDKRVEKNNKFVDEYNRGSRIMFGIAFVLLVVLLSLCSCDSLSTDDCEEYNQTVEHYEELIQWARDNGDSIQVHLLIDERNSKLSDLDC